MKKQSLLLTLGLCCWAYVALAQNKNLADDQPSAKINPRLTEHSRKMEQRVYKVTDNVYSRVGFGAANSTMIIGSDGIIIFEGDPTALDPPPRNEASKRYIALMGGREAVLTAARKAFEADEYQWTAELLTHLIRLNKEDMEARKLKADALRRLAYKTENSNWRNWYISSARELDGSLNKTGGAVVMSSLAAPDILKALPVSKFFESMTVRLDPVKSADAHVTMAFRFTDVGKVYAVEVRRGIAQVHESMPLKVDATLLLTTADLQRVMARQTTFVQMLQAGEIKAEGNVATLARFNSFFDAPATEAPQLTIR